MAGKGNKVEEYRKLFKASDENGDGFLSIVEFRNMLKRGGCNMSDSQIADTFVFFDGPKGDKRITCEEFEKGLSQIIEFVERVKVLFRELDADGSGYLDQAELTTLLQKSGRKFTEREIKQMVKDVDKDGNNKISFEEFVDALS